MKIIFVIALIVFFASTVFAQSMSASSFYGAKKFSYEINVATLASTPSWDPERESPPLTLSQAIISARVGLKRFAPASNGNWDVEKIEMSKIGWEANKWIYEVEFRCREAKCPDDDSLRVFVKLDGKVLEPEITADNEPRNVKSGQIRVGTKKPN
jgi:hypothetical protein